MSGREEILGRVRSAIADVPAGEPVSWSLAEVDETTDYRRGRESATEELTAQFAERCADYRAHVVRCTDDDAAIAAAVAEACSRHGARRLALPPGLPDAWVPAEPERRVDDPPLTLPELDGCDAVISGCALAIAETGTIVLDAGEGQGRRALTLVPDLHVCVVRAGQIVVGVPEAVAAMAEPVGAGGRPITLISGPSATSDIELKRVEGVHGPRRLEVVLAG